MRGPVPDPYSGVVAATGKFGVGGRKGESVNGLLVVRIEGLDRRNAGTPVLDVAARVARQQVIVVVRPGHAAKRSVVRRQYHFKTKVDAVPQSEFAFGVARQQAATARRPTQTDNGRGILGPRHVGRPGQVQFRNGRCAADGTNGKSHETYLRGVWLQVTVVVPHVVTATRFTKETVLLAVNHSGSVVVDAATNQIAFGRFLLGVLIGLIVVATGGADLWFETRHGCCGVYYKESIV